MAEDQKPAKWRTIVGNNEWGVVKYGIVEYLRKHPRMRAATAGLGCLWLLGWIVSLAGFKWQFSALLPTVSAIFGAPTLLWLAIEAGPDFELTFAEQKTPSVPQVPAIEAKGPIDPESYGIDALNKSYTDLNAYARSGFRWGISAFLLSIVLTTGGMWLVSGRFERLGQMQVLPIAAFIIASPYLISVVLILRSTLLFRRASTVHDRLIELQKTIIAIKYIEASSEAKKVIEATPAIGGLLSLQSTKDDRVASILKAS